jgi:hypothetical protein
MQKTFLDIAYGFPVLSWIGWLLLINLLSSLCYTEKMSNQSLTNQRLATIESDRCDLIGQIDPIQFFREGH